MTRKMLLGYYAATVVFLLLDYVAGINVRVAFLETAPALRAGFYGILFVCLALILWRPQWADVIGTVESLVTLIALIINMAMRSMVVTDAMLDTGTGFVTIAEIFNFLISGSVAYFVWARGMQSVFGQNKFFQ